MPVIKEDMSNVAYLLNILALASAFYLLVYFFKNEGMVFSFSVVSFGILCSFVAVVLFVVIFVSACELDDIQYQFKFTKIGSVILGFVFFLAFFVHTYFVNKEIALQKYNQTQEYKSIDIFNFNIVRLD